MVACNCKFTGKSVKDNTIYSHSSEKHKKDNCEPVYKSRTRAKYKNKG